MPRIAKQLSPSEISKSLYNKEVKSLENKIDRLKKHIESNDEILAIKKEKLVTLENEMKSLKDCEHSFK